MKHDKSVINLVVTPPPPPSPPPPIKALVAGNFYVQKSTGDLVFAASTTIYGEREVRMEGDTNSPTKDTPVVAIGGLNNGISLRGMFAGSGAYEPVDVEITIKPRS